MHKKAKIEKETDINVEKQTNKNINDKRVKKDMEERAGYMKTAYNM